MNIFSVIGISRLNLQDFPEMKKKKELSTMCVFPNIGKIMAASGISTYPLECTIVASWSSQPTLFCAAQERQFLAELGEINQREQFRKWPPYLLWFPWPTLLIDIQDQADVQGKRKMWMFLLDAWPPWSEFYCCFETVCIKHKIKIDLGTPREREWIIFTEYLEMKTKPCNIFFWGTLDGKKGKCKSQCIN